MELRRRLCASATGKQSNKAQPKTPPHSAPHLQETFSNPDLMTKWLVHVKAPVCRFLHRCCMLLSDIEGMERRMKLAKRSLAIATGSYSRQVAESSRTGSA